MQALEKEWLLRMPELAHKKIVSIYFGGGTPSLLGPERLQAIIQWIQRDVGFDPMKTEITLEANPENITTQLMKDYASTGINRVSIGVQTLSESLLKKLERQHDAQKAIDAVSATLKAGIGNITIDLMYDLPNQTLEIWEETISKASQLPIQHLSLYNLTIEPHTSFFKHQEELQKTLPDPDISLKMYEKAQETLTASGLKQYEISAFAREGYQSRHNTGYWKARPFLGFGPSAFSYWDSIRFRNIAHLRRYAYQLDQGKFPVDFKEQLDEQASLRELLTIRLRLCEGVHLVYFEGEYGQLDKETLKNIEQLENKGYIERNNEIIRLTKQGILFYDSVAVDLI